VKRFSSVLVWACLAAGGLAVSVMPACAQRPMLWQRRANTFLLEIGKRPMEIELITESAVRIARGVPPSVRRAYSDNTLEANATGLPDGMKIETSELSIVVSNATGTVTVSLPGGLRLLAETSVRLIDGEASVEFEIQPSEKLYGFGARPHKQIDARGLALQPKPASYLSSRGYAVWIPGSAPLRFDIGKTRQDRLSIHGEGVRHFEYFLAFGPSVKEIWEQRMKAEGAIETPASSDLELILGARLPKAATPLAMTGNVCEDARALVHASLSGVFIPAFDLARYRSADEATFRRAAKLGLFSPVLYDSSHEPFTAAQQRVVDEAATARKRLNHYLLVYADEVRARGYPMIHPLLMQFPRDPLAGTAIEEYMFGDEMLVIPFCDATPRSVYLPMGQWTDWETGRIFTGKQTVTLESPASGAVVLAKSGSVIPLNGLKPGEPTELHYFPKNGGEFFIYEPAIADYTQAHASPAADIYRLEIESKVYRRYEWVVHHMERPAGVEQVQGAAYEETQAPGSLSPGTWRYDANNRTLHVGVEAPAYSDIIVNIRF
jgi:alpha-glucosidase (family GH31 glycosyl hydrolase)